MPGLSDIPEQHLSPDRQIDFLHWLAALPISVHEARATMKLWASATGRTFTGQHWDFIERNFRRKNG